MLLLWSLIKGAICVSKVLEKCSLQVLYLSNNVIGDDGVNAIAGALSMSKIIELYASGCGITFIGARYLSLRFNRRIEILGVKYNPITVEGACLILQSAVDNGVCLEVCIDDEYHCEMKEMMSKLEQRRDNQLWVTVLCYVMYM